MQLQRNGYLHFLTARVIRLWEAPMLAAALAIVRAALQFPAAAALSTALVAGFRAAV